MTTMSSTNTPSPEWVLTLRPYQPGKPVEELERELGITGSIKLASNENPLGPSPKAMEAIREASSSLHLYPDAASYALRERLAEHLGAPMERIVLGNGSNEIITLLARAFVTPGDAGVIGEYGFIAYRLVLTGAGAEVRRVAMPNLTHDVDAMAAACDERTRLLFLANPNNPTGTWNDAEQVRRLLRSVPGHVIVVLDEAYAEYVDDPRCPDGMTLLGERENLVVMRTFSKAYGLAGSRVGYAVVPEYVADRIHRVREPFNINALAQAGARAALDDTDFLVRTVTTNERVKAVLEAGLDELGIEHVKGQGNFVLMRAPGGGAAMYDALLRRGVIVRPLAPYGLDDYVRVSVGTDDENARLLEALAVVAGR